MKTGNSGFTLVEVMMAIALLCFTALTYLYAMGQGHQVAGMSSQRLQALHIARDVMEQVRAQDYADMSSISEQSLPSGFRYKCDVSSSGSFTDTKDIVVTVTWQDVAGSTMSSIDLCSSATKWLH